MNEKYYFDKDNEALYDIKKVLQTKIKEFVANIDKWGNKKQNP